jgi:hypothetical protein
MVELQELVDQHYQIRFNARNTGVVERDSFSENVESWLRMQEKSSAGNRVS